ncbi:HAD family phosphatase [Pedobacter polaris]|uniref:HAD family phosphatase n=1 Tax=Pedobacter polaris TaxID=2571273 RepID=A0A4U1CVJ9_9SPHI|nr:HAD family phosphatase [Pedobacter polaris]TKC13261.1 HAD family phosphatase [Pedobacter polaris]
MLKPKAFLFDLNGTMIDDMEYHARAWYSILNEDLNAGLSYADVKKEMYGKNRELLHRIFGSEHFTSEREDELSLEKERRYQKEYAASLALINGLPDFLKKAKANHIKMAIGSAAIPFNINFVLDGLQIRDYFETIVSADDVKISKPDPETFVKAAGILGIAPSECIVFEDAPKGVEAAENANMPCVVLTTMHEKEEFINYKNIIAFVKDYNDTILETLF